MPLDEVGEFRRRSSLQVVSWGAKGTCLIVCNLRRTCAVGKAAWEMQGRLRVWGLGSTVREGCFVPHGRADGLGPGASPPPRPVPSTSHCVRPEMATRAGSGAWQQQAASYKPTEDCLSLLWVASDRKQTQATLGLKKIISRVRPG